MKTALIQMNSQNDKDANIRDGIALIERAVAEEKPDMVVLPEMWTFHGGTAQDRRDAAERVPDGPVYGKMADLAAKHGIILHAGSMLEVASNGKVHNTTLVFGRDGSQLALYRKIHLFDIVAPDGTKYLESEAVEPGRDIVTYEVDGITVGCAICYDIRFPELFRRLRDAGAQVIVLPAAFTLMTGKDHWEVLARARAIETQTYFLAVGQVGTYDGGKKATWGHTMAIEPWGAVVAQMPDRVGYVCTRFDWESQARIRQNVPIQTHRVLD
jgi:nitrilase